MDKVCTYVQMEIDMKDSGLTVWNMDRELIFTFAAIPMLVITKTVNHMDKGPTFGQMGKSTMENFNKV